MPSPFDVCVYGRCPEGVPIAGRERVARNPFRAILCAALALSAICGACGAVGPAAPGPVSVTVTPNSAQPFQGESVQFSAVVNNTASAAVSWQVNQVAGGNSNLGTISSSGYYTAPNTVPSPATVTITALLQSDPSQSGSASVTIQSLSGVQGLVVSPRLASVTLSQSLQLQIVTAGVTASDVSWSVDGFPGGNAGVGEISATGLYAPPGTAGSHTITATLFVNRGATGSAQVAVTDFAGTLTWRNDSSRSGINRQELALSPASVSSAMFGRLFSCSVDGDVYAEPLYVPNLAIPGKGTHNVVFVATEMDSVYAFDADSNANPCVPIWQAHSSLLAPGTEPIQTPNFQITSMDIAPFVGITGTPAIDPVASVIYVVVATETPGTNPTYDHRIFALDLATGNPVIQPGGVGISTIGAQSAGFSSTFENQRPALLLDNGSLYIAFGSYGGDGEYHGWLFRYDAASLTQTGFFDVTPQSLQGGIWQSGGGPSADSNQNVYVATGDGPFDANRGGMSYSDSFLKFGPSGGLSVLDFFTPCDQAAEQAAGNDVGGSALVLLPDSAGSELQPHLMLGGSKGGSLYVMDRDNMGGFDVQCPDLPARVQTVSAGGPILSTPLFWNGEVYVVPGAGNLISFPMAAGALASSPASTQSPESLGPLGATPVISTNGAGDAVLWLIDSSGALASPGGAAVLRAYDSSNLSNEIYNSAMNSKRDAAGPAVKFTVPTVANGKVYVGARQELDAYGLLP